MLGPVCHEPVTFVNAPLLAAERGIEVTESKTRHSRDWVNLITLSGEGSWGTVGVAGTTVGPCDNERLWPSTASPSTWPWPVHMAFLFYEDRPGVIGGGDAARRERRQHRGDMQVGRRKQGGEALMALTVDAGIPAGVLDRVEWRSAPTRRPSSSSLRRSRRMTRTTPEAVFPILRRRAAAAGRPTERLRRGGNEKKGAHKTMLAVAEQIIVFDTTLRDGEQARHQPQRQGQGRDRRAAGLAWASTSSRPGSPRPARATSRPPGRSPSGSRAPPSPPWSWTAPGDVDRAAEAFPPRRPGPAAHLHRHQPHPHGAQAAQDPGRGPGRGRGRGSAAKGYTDDIEFAEDATRSDPEFLKQVYAAAAIAAGATTCNVPDTVGYMLPGAFSELRLRLIAETLGADRGAVWSVHCHDDLGGLSPPFHLRRRRAPARSRWPSTASASVGNCSMEEAVMALRTHQSSLGGQDRRQHPRDRLHLAVSLTGYLIQLNKAIVGSNAFAHESGIHQHGVLMERTTYEYMTWSSWATPGRGSCSASTWPRRGRRPSRAGLRPEPRGAGQGLHLVQGAGRPQAPHHRRPTWRCWSPARSWPTTWPPGASSGPRWPGARV